ncbi:YihY/virulence factor BrkB family protein [Thermoleptolyngbya sp. M55_K2018_002]|uniref:YihY/virulence factor BrkB family protein n=1 Tax=Thermoleptolyngbya sp. M55_K2018_002 TaxID=2747808 RepID=UPI001A085674|nr:YhjD/YihY/BrkB family envelope integrity protein [Thermoleptolyngbya sp. M55_K2018_002]HIK43060.1 YihY/virulence factor BrkB family protein [Thermoleptolyngbya sp. M55_K2018_002]
MKNPFSQVFQLFFLAVLKWQKDNCLDMGATLSYHALFSLFPLLLLSLSLLGSLLGRNAELYTSLQTLLQEALPPEAYRIVESSVLVPGQDTLSIGLLGLVFLLVAASNFFYSLDRAFDKIWGVAFQPEPGQSAWKILRVLLRKKAFSVMLVIGTAPLLFVSLVSDLLVQTGLELLEKTGGTSAFLEPLGIDSVEIVWALQALFSFLILALIIMILFRILPSTNVTWGDVWLGALLTAGMLLLLQYLVHNSVLSLGDRFRSYGVVGRVMVLMFWIYLTSQVFFLGGELTCVYAQLFGSRRNADPQQEPSLE